MKVDVASCYDSILPTTLFDIVKLALQEVNFRFISVIGRESVEIAITCAI